MLIHDKIKVDLMICQINMDLIITSDDQETPGHTEILIKTGDFYSHRCLIFGGPIGRRLLSQPRSI